MGLTVTTRATSTRLTTRARVLLEIPSIVAGDYAFIDQLLDDATGAVQSYCNRNKAPFARQAYQETLPAFGDVSLMLKATPIVSVTSVLFDGSPITDYSIEDADAGILYRRSRFPWTVQIDPGFSGRQTFPSFGAPMPEALEPRFTANYVAGFLMPGQDVSAATISAAAADNSFNDSAAGFPSLLQAGDFLITAGFANAANNGTFTVTGTPSTSKIVVTATLTTEAVGPTVTVTFQTLPSDLEKAAVEAIKAWYGGRADDGSIVEKQVGPMRIRFAEQGGAGRLALPPTCIGLLRPWARAA